MPKHRKASLAWNVFCDNDGTVIGRFAVVGNVVRVDCPGGETKSLGIEPGEGFLSLVESALTEGRLAHLTTVQ
jgi:hypothetical protein